MLRIEWTSTEPERAAHELLAVAIGSTDLDSLDDLGLGSIAAAAAAARFRGKPSESFSLTEAVAGGLRHIVLLGVGDGLDSAETVRTFAHDVSRRAQEVGATRAVIRFAGTRGDAAPTGPALGAIVAQGLELGLYRYDRFRSEEDRAPRTLIDVVVVDDDTGAVDGSERGLIAASCIARARDLANGPAELVTPTHLAEVATAMVDGLSTYDVSVEILDREACEARGMGCFLAVARGSDAPPRFIHLGYRPAQRARGRVCLIGKGVTFDSGGYSLKPTDGMLDMKMDMAGAAAVLSSFEGLVRLGVPYEVHVLVAATENMVSGKAYRLGDVFTASNGKTVEINNTDAEGRLTLADALVFADGLEPDLVIDFATLTGACVVALGPRIAGVMSDDDALVAGWMDAAGRSGERMWRLPLPPDLKEQLESKVADIKNTGERWGGALTAGLFLSEFTGGRRWMHVDIAGPAMAAKPHGVTREGGTGFGVATILELLSAPRLP